MYAVLVALLVIETLFTTLGAAAYFLWLLSRVRGMSIRGDRARLYSVLYVPLRRYKGQGGLRQVLIKQDLTGALQFLTKGSSLLFLAF